MALTTRSLELLGLRLGDRLQLALTDVASAERGQGRAELTVVGSYQPFALDDSYWLGRQLFGYVPHSHPQGLADLPPVSDTVLVGEGFAKDVGLTGYTLDVPVDASRLDLDTAPVAAAQVATCSTVWACVGALVTSQLPVVVEQAAERSRVVRVAAPLAAAQLVLLAWVILAHVVGSATQERAPELGLAKLRGQSPGRTVRFGLAEVVLLLLVAAPLGALAGWLLVRWSASHVLEAGTAVHLTRWVALSVVIGVLGGVGAAAVAAHGVGRQHVADLLRRVPGPARVAGPVPSRGRCWRSCSPGSCSWRSPGGRRRDRWPWPPPASSRSAAPCSPRERCGCWLGGAPPGRSTTAVRPRLLGWAGVLRRTGVARTTGVLTAAIALLLVGVQAWSVAGRERAVRAGAENGAAVVLAAQASSPRALLDAVRAVDPGGDEAMAVVRLPGGDTNPPVLAVDAARADRVLAFGHQDPGGLASILRPGASGPAGPSGRSGSAGAAVLPETLLVRPGVVEVSMRVDALTSPSPLTASVTVERPGTVERARRTPVRTARHGWSCRSASCARVRTPTAPTSRRGARRGAGSSGSRCCTPAATSPRRPRT